MGPESLEGEREGRERERRELERRAYGRDGPALTAADAERLAELRAASTRPEPLADAGSAAWAGAEPAAPPGHGRDLALWPAVQREHDAAGAASAGPGEPAPPVARREDGRSWFARLIGSEAARRPRSVIGALIALVLVGVAIGASFPRTPMIGIALQGGEEERRAAVLARLDDLDAGSLVLLDRQGTVLLWTATRSGGSVRCAMIDAPGAVGSMDECRANGEFRRSPLSFTSIPEPVTGVSRSPRLVYSATVMISPSGVPVGGLTQQVWDMRGRSPMSAADAAQYQRLSAQEQVKDLRIVGRWDGLTIWFAFTDTSERCLFVENGALQRACIGSATTLQFEDGTGAFEPAPESVIALDLAATDDHPWARLTYTMPAANQPYLTITENADPLGAFGPHPAS